MDMLNPVGRVYCGYCLGDAEFNQDKTRWEHATNGERITGIAPGDYVSAAPNQAGTKINAVDLIDDSEDEPEDDGYDVNDDGPYDLGPDADYSYPGYVDGVIQA